MWLTQEAFDRLALELEALSTTGRDEIVKRMEGVPKEKQAEEGVKIAVESMQRIKEMPGVRGFHIMAIEWEQKVPEIVERAGLFPRPQV